MNNSFCSVLHHYFNYLYISYRRYQFKTFYISAENAGPNSTVGPNTTEGPNPPETTETPNTPETTANPNPPSFSKFCTPFLI